MIECKWLLQSANVRGGVQVSQENNLFMNRWGFQNVSSEPLCECARAPGGGSFSLKCSPPLRGA